MRMILIFGGIGSGKSVVSRMLRLRGAEVYDCDLEAKEIMKRNREIRDFLLSESGEDIFTSYGELNRPKLASRLFSDLTFRTTLNALVHAAVKEDLKKKVEAGKGKLYVESAIPATAGMVGMCDEIWMVDCPEEIRTDRVMQRNGLSREEVEMRIRSQMGEEEATMAEAIALRIPVKRIVNDGSSSVMMQVLKLCNEKE